MKLNLRNAVLAATIIITAAVAFLLVPSGARQEKFYTTLIFLLFAEITLASYPFRNDRGALPFLLAGLLVVSPLYFLGVVVLVLVAAFSTLVFAPLLALHLIWLLGLIVFGALIVAAGRHAANVEDNFQQSRQPFVDFRNRFQQLNNRVALLDNSRFAEVKAKVEKKNEELRYCPTETIDETVPLTMELSSLLEELEQLVSSCENGGTDEKVEMLAGDIDKLLKVFSQKLERRSSMNLQVKK